MPSHTRVAAPVAVRYFFGVDRSASYKGRIMDAKLDQLAVAHAQDQNEPARQFVLAAGQVGSYLEGAIFEQAFLAEVPYGVSAVSLLKAATDQGVRVYTITSGNASQAISPLQTSEGVKDDVRNAVAAGMRVTIAQRDVIHYGYSGIGYIIEDPQTGSAAYLIDGGLAGGSSPGPTYVYPMPQPVATPLHNLILGSSIRTHK